MQAAFILVVLFSTGGFTAEFADRLSCTEAVTQISSTYGKGTGFLTAFCTPAASLGGNRK